MHSGRLATTVFDPGKSVERTGDWQKSFDQTNPWCRHCMKDVRIGVRYEGPPVVGLLLFHDPQQDEGIGAKSEVDHLP